MRLLPLMEQGERIFSPVNHVDSNDSMEEYAGIPIVSPTRPSDDDNDGMMGADKYPQSNNR